MTGVWERGLQKKSTVLKVFLVDSERRLKTTFAKKKLVFFIVWRAECLVTRASDTASQSFKTLKIHLRKKSCQHHFFPKIFLMYKHDKRWALFKHKSIYCQKLLLFSDLGLGLHQRIYKIFFRTVGLVRLFRYVKKKKTIKTYALGAGFELIPGVSLLRPEEHAPIHYATELKQVLSGKTDQQCIPVLTVYIVASCSSHYKRFFGDI